jgi:hypothetical protein
MICKKEIKMHEELQICKICGFKAKSNNSLSTHLKMKHNISLYQYIEKYFELPICSYCR